jgi:transposase
VTVFGFDVAKDSVVVAGLDEQASVLERHTLMNSEEVIRVFLSGVQARYPEAFAVVESTADYHRPLALAGIAQGLTVKLINPILTKQFTRSTVRKTKTDRTDAEIIAKLGLQGEGRIVTRETFAKTKTFVRTAESLAHTRISLHRMQTRLTQILPEEEALLTALQECQDQLEKAVVRFREEAKESTDPATGDLLRSIPGIGPVIATTLIAEIGTIDRFDSPEALIAYAGLDPKVRQSGTSLHHNTTLTKRGSNTLRTALFQAASVARQHDPELRAYYETKRSQGRQYREATVAVARKIANRVYAVWKRRSKFIPKTS